MRVPGTEVADDDDTAVDILFEGRPLRARRGETIAATLCAHGEHSMRRTAEGGDRGLFCGMGVCQECLVEVDGRPNRRACMTKVEGEMSVRRQSTPPALRNHPCNPAVHKHEQAPDPDIVVIGGGAAGLSAAAIAAESGARVVLVDERPVPGGQYFKQPLDTIRTLPHTIGDTQFEGGRRLVDRARSAGVEMIAGTVWSATPEPAVSIFDGTASRTLKARRLIVAGGAYERGVPLPGWTLPGVMTTGAAQTLLRSYAVLAGRRILVAGNGPLNLQVASELARAGAKIVAVAEQARKPGLHSLRALLTMARTAPDLMLQGRNYLRDLKRRGIPVHFAHTLTAIDGTPGALSATLSDMRGNTRNLVADAVLMGYGFQPSNELLRLLGCGHDHDLRRGHLMTRRDADCRTTCKTVFAIGDCCGLGGARAARSEGIVAGLAAAQDCSLTASGALAAEQAQARTDITRQRRFQDALWSLFAPIGPIPDASPDTLVCRCEGVTLAAVDRAIADGFGSMSEIKRLTRLGMGRCQGRYCAPALADRLALQDDTARDEFSLFAPRPPVKPVPIEAVAESPDE